LARKGLTNSPECDILEIEGPSRPRGREPVPSDYEIALMITRKFFGKESTSMARGLVRAARLLLKTEHEEDEKI
jgi:hypothetical protein